MNDIIFFIKDVGFPIGISIYLLVIGTRVITDNTKAMIDLRLIIQELCDKSDMSGRGQPQP